MLKRKNIVILIIAVICGFIGVILVISYVSSVKTVYNERPTAEVIVAAQDIPEHVKVTRIMLQTISVESQYILPQALTKIEDITGAMTTTKIFKGEQIMKGRVSKGDNPSEFAYGIPDGKRAISLALDPVRGVAGFIRPHDRIDILVTLTPPKDDDDGEQEAEGKKEDYNAKVFRQIAQKLLGGRRLITFDEESITFTLYQNIEVLAVGKKVTNSGGDKKEDSEGDEGGTITLCLDPEQAELITNAEKVGNIKFNLRNPGDDAIVGLKPVVEYKDSGS